MEQWTTPGGETVHVTREEGDRGAEAPFFVAYLTPDRERRYGWFCGHCESLDTAMDPMGRVECNRCGNYRKPTTWDAAHE